MPSQSPALRRKVAAQMADYRERLAERVRYEREREQMSRDELALKAGLNPKIGAQVAPENVYLPIKFVVEELPSGF